MLDRDLDKLVKRDAMPLDGIEAQIWRQEARRSASLAATRRLASWQAGIMVVAIMGSAAFGASVAAQSPANAGNIFAVHAASAPSVRLFGHHP